MASDSQSLLTAVLTKLGPGSEVIAKTGFEGTSKDHLSFIKGDIMTILAPDPKKRADDGWCLAMAHNNRTGLVPTNHLQTRTEVKLNAMPWFHGKITRDEAENLLKPPKVSVYIFEHNLKFHDLLPIT